MIATGISTAWIERSLAPMGSTLLMILVSLATALLMLLVFRLTTDQEGLRRAKARVVGQVLAIRVFPDDPWVTLRALGGALWANLAYLRHSLLPLLVMLVPLVLLLLEMDLWFSRRPLEPGESTTLAVMLAEGHTADSAIQLHPPEGLRVETPALYIPTLGELNWRIRPVEEGTHTLVFDRDGTVFKKRVVCSEKDNLRRICATRTGGGLPAALLNPGEPALDAATGVASVTLDYPSRSFEVIGIEMHWILAYILFSLILAFILKRPLGVEV